MAYVLCHKWDHGLIGFQKFLSVSIFNISHVGNIGTYIFKVNASQHVREASCVWKWAIYLQFCSLIGKVMIHPQIGGFSPKSSGTKPNMYPRNLLITMVWREAHPRPESVHIHHNFPQHRGLPKKKIEFNNERIPHYFQDSKFQLRSKKKTPIVENADFVAHRTVHTIPIPLSFDDQNRNPIKAPIFGWVLPKVHSSPTMAWFHDDFHVWTSIKSIISMCSTYLWWLWGCFMIGSITLNPCINQKSVIWHMRLSEVMGVSLNHPG